MRLDTIYNFTSSAYPFFPRRQKNTRRWLFIEGKIIQIKIDIRHAPLGEGKVMPSLCSNEMGQGNERREIETCEWRKEPTKLVGGLFKFFFQTANLLLKS